MRPQISALIVVGHEILRKGLVGLFADWERTVFSAEADTGDAAIQRLGQGDINLILLDWCMPEVEGAGLIERIRGIGCSVPVLVLSMHEEPLVASAALKAGASGFLTKGCPPDILYAAAETLLQGGCYIDRTVTRLLVARREAVVCLPIRLNKRQREIFHLICSGANMERIASRMDMTLKATVALKAALMRDMDARSDLELIRLGLALGMDAKPQS